MRELRENHFCVWVNDKRTLYLKLTISLLVLLLALTQTRRDCVELCSFCVCVCVSTCSQENRKHLDPRRKMDQRGEKKNNTITCKSLQLLQLPGLELKSALWTPRMKKAYMIKQNKRHPGLSQMSHSIPAKLHLGAHLATVILPPSHANRSHLSLCVGLEAVGAAQHMFPRE